MFATALNLYLDVSNVHSDWRTLWFDIFVPLVKNELFVMVNSESMWRIDSNAVLEPTETGLCNIPLV